MYQPWPRSDERRLEAVIAAIVESANSRWIEQLDWYLPYWMSEVVNRMNLPVHCRTEAAADTWVLDLGPSCDATFRDKISTGIRRDIRYSARKGVTITRAPSSEEVFSFAALWEERYEELGWNGIRFGKDFFQHVTFLCSGRSRLILAKAGEKVIGGALFLDEEKGAVYYAAAFDPNYKAFFPMHAILNDEIHSLCDSGKEYLNFGGIGSNEKLATFKSRWGATPRQIKRLVCTNQRLIETSRRSVVNRAALRLFTASIERIRRRFSRALLETIASKDGGTVT